MTGNIPEKPQRAGPRRNVFARFAAGLDRLAGRSGTKRLAGPARRFLSAPSPPQAPVVARAQDASLERTRAALSEARTQMPGLLGGDGPAPASSGGGLDLQTLVTQASASAFSSVEFSVGIGSVARLEEAILRLDDERRQLSAEVSALRLAVVELREMLTEDSGLRTQDSVVAAVLPPPMLLQACEAPGTRAATDVAVPNVAQQGAVGERHDERRQQGVLESQSEDTLTPDSDPDAGIVYPFGSVGVPLRVATDGGPVALDRLHRALTAPPEVDSVRLVSYVDGVAEFRVYLRQPLARARLLAAVGEAEQGLRGLSA